MKDVQQDCPTCSRIENGSVAQAYDGQVVRSTTLHIPDSIVARGAQALYGSGWDSAGSEEKYYHMDAVRDVLYEVYHDIQAEGFKEAAAGGIPTEALGGSTRAWLTALAVKKQGTSIKMQRDEEMI